MSERAVEVVRRSFEAIGRGDVDALLELYDPEIEFQPLTGTQVESGGYRGHAGVRKYFTEAADIWDEVRPVIGDVMVIGDEVIVFGVCAIRGKASKIETTSPTAWVVTVRDGVITRHRVFRTNDEALEAAASSE